MRNAIHPGRLTWNLQITHLERKMIFQTSTITFHVNLPGCNCFSTPFQDKSSSSRSRDNHAAVWQTMRIRHWAFPSQLFKNCLKRRTCQYLNMPRQPVRTTKEMPWSSKLTPTLSNSHQPLLPSKDGWLLESLCSSSV